MEPWDGWELRDTSNEVVVFRIVLWSAADNRDFELWEEELCR